MASQKSKFSKRKPLPASESRYLRSDPTDPIPSLSISRSCASTSVSEPGNDTHKFCFSGHAERNGPSTALPTLPMRPSLFVTFPSVPSVPVAQDRPNTGNCDFSPVVTSLLSKDQSSKQLTAKTNISRFQPSFLYGQHSTNMSDRVSAAQSRPQASNVELTHRNYSATLCPRPSRSSSRKFTISMSQREEQVLPSRSSSVSNLGSLSPRPVHASKILSQSVHDNVSSSHSVKNLPITTSSLSAPIRRRSTSTNSAQLRPRRRDLRPIRPTLPSLPPPIVGMEWAAPTWSQLAFAASLQVTDESGLRVSFGSLFRNCRTIVVFIRHFWCPSCQDYMSSLASLVNSAPVFSRMPAPYFDSCNVQQRIQLIIIGNGSHLLISKYKQMLSLPFSFYTDPSLSLYAALGMRRLDGDYKISKSAARNREPEKEVVNGDYVRHGPVGGMVLILLRALKIGMPLFENGGDSRQLGGEFIFGPGLECTFAHRMQVVKGHASSGNVLEAAGLSLPIVRAKSHSLQIPVTPKHEDHRPNVLKKARRGHHHHVRKGVNLESDQENLAVEMRKNCSSPLFEYMTSDEEAAWMMERTRKLEQLREKRNLRRAFVGHATI